MSFNVLQWLFHFKSKQVFRYIGAGLINTTVAFGVFTILTFWTPSPYWLSNFFAVTLSVLSGYFLSRVYVFESVGRSVFSSGWRYVLTICAQYLVGTITIGLLKNIGLDDMLSYLIALPVMVVTSYFLQFYWVFPNKNDIDVDDISHSVRRSQPKR